MSLYDDIQQLLETYRLDPRIGSYTIEGQVTAALTYLPVDGFGSAFPPAGTEIDGLEVVLVRSNYKGDPYLGGSRITESVDVLLKSWQQSDTNRESLAKELYGADPRAWTLEFVQRSENRNVPNISILTFIEFEEC